MVRAKAGGRGNGGVEARFGRLETAQRETNQRLGRIEKTLETSSRLSELMHERLEALVEGQKAFVEGQKALVEGQKALVEGQKALVEGQKAVIERLDRLVEASTRERKYAVERLGKLEARVEAIEKRLEGH